MAVTQSFPLVDRILGGTLAEQLRGWRSEGLSHHGITLRLAAEHDVVVSPATVRRWLKDLPVEEVA